MLTQGAVIHGEYRILHKIAQGEIGEVYKAVLRRSEELHAIKVMNAELMRDQLLVRRFKQEAAQAQSFQHANAVRVEGIEETEDGRPFLVMEHIPGQSLKDLIEREGRLPVARVCSIVKQLASALDAAHRRAIIHQDLKPSNILLVAQDRRSDTAGSGEQAKVLDFCISRIKEDRRRDMGRITLKGTGILMGTPQYFSPEQAVGKRGDDLDGRSDLYSLGVVMYQMLSGDFPFPAFKSNTTMEVLLAHLLTPPTPIAQLDPGLCIPGDIANLVMKMLEKKRELRPASAKAVIEELERWDGLRLRIPDAQLKDSVEAGLRLRAPDAAPKDSDEAGLRVQAAEAGLKGSDKSLSSEFGVREQKSGFRLPIPYVRLRDPRWLFPLLTAIMAVGLSVGALYFNGRRLALLRPSASGSSTLRGGSTSPTASPAAPQGPELGTGGSGSASWETGKAAPPRPPESVTSQSGSPGVRTKSAGSGSLGTKPLARKPSVDRKKVESAMTEGDRCFQRGEYDLAIHAYESGLALDPANKKLRGKIVRAASARAAEARYLNE